MLFPCWSRRPPAAASRGQRQEQRICVPHREGDGTILLLPCLKTASILPPCREQAARVRDSSRLRPAPALAPFRGSSALRKDGACISSLFWSFSAPSTHCFSLPGAVLVNRDTSPSPLGFQSSSPAGSQANVHLLLWLCSQKPNCPKPPLVSS